MKKHHSRKEKLEVLQAAVGGNTTALRHYQQQQKEVWYLVVTDNGNSKPTDLVEARLPGNKGSRLMPYADFLKDPAAYGNSCITAN